MEPPDGPGERRCQSCGESLEPADRYCPSCGRRVDRSGPEESASDGVETGTQVETDADRHVETDADRHVETDTDRHVETDADTHVESDTQIEHGDRADGWGEENRTDEVPQAGRSPGSPGSLLGQETRLRTVGVAVGLGILGPVFLIVGTLLAAVVLGLIGVPQNAFIVLATSISQIFGFGGVALLYLRRRGYDWEQIRSYLGVRVPTLRELGVVIGGYVGIIVSLIGISIAATLFLPEPAQNQGAQQAIENPEIIPAMILMMLLVVGPFEELLFRGVVQNRLRENFDVFPAIAIASGIFASVHVIALAGSLVGMLVTVTILFFPATIFGYVYEYTGNLVVPALLHGIHNSILLSLIFLGPELEGESAAVVVETVLALG